MKIYIDNIGVIKESEVEINSITVITGYNNSGKTTVGRVLYSIISAIEDLEENAFEDKKALILYRIKKLLNNFIPMYSLSASDRLNLGNSIGKRLLEYIGNNDVSNLAELERYCHSVKELFEAILNAPDDVLMGIYKEAYKESYGRSIVDQKNNNLVEYLKEIDKYISLCQDDLDATKYADSKIIQYLQGEFFGQIIPMRYPSRMGKIEVKSENGSFVDLSIEKNELIKNGVYRRDVSHDIKRVIMIEDSDVLDHLGEPFIQSRGLPNIYIQLESIKESELSILSYEKHADALLRRLQLQGPLYQDIGNEEITKNIFDAIDPIFSESIVYARGRSICSESKLDVRNLASGVKLFAMLRQLLVKGQLDSNTLLILDEPDNHLHPAWQSILARILFLLANNLGVKILLTTHSTNLLYALQTDSRLHSMGKLIVYDAVEYGNDDYSIKYKQVEGDLNQIYYKLGKPLFELRKRDIKYED